MQDGVYMCRFKGNTLVDITPPFFGLFNRRAEFVKDKTPMHKVTRCVTPLVLEW